MTDRDPSMFVRFALVFLMSLALGAVYLFITADVCAGVFYTVVWFVVFHLGYKVYDAEWI